MKKLVEMLSAFLIMIFVLEPCTANGVATEYKSEASEELIWEELSKYSPSDAITAGIMGYFFRESQMRSDAIAGWPQRNLTLFKEKTYETQHDKRRKASNSRKRFDRNRWYRGEASA